MQFKLQNKPHNYKDLKTKGYKECLKKQFKQSNFWNQADFYVHFEFELSFSIAYFWKDNKSLISFINHSDIWKKTFHRNMYV